MFNTNKKYFINYLSLIISIFLFKAGDGMAQDTTNIRKISEVINVDDTPNMKNLNYIAHRLTNDIKPPATLEEFEEQRAELRKKALKIIGLDPMPEKTPLNVKYVGDKVDLGNCYFRRVVYESRPHIYVAAHLYIPKNVTFPVPAVIHVPGHGRRDAYRPHPRTYAENGFVAIGLPMVGEEGKIGAGWGACGEYGPYVGHLNWYNTGYSAVAPTVWDGIRTVDFLLTLTDDDDTKLVDENKIGMAGLSGGSARTLWTTIAEPRISAAVVNQGVTAIEGYNSLDGGISSTCDIHLFFNYFGFSYGQMYSLIAPRKFLLQNGTQDALYPNPQPVVNYLKSVYNLYGESDSFEYKTYDQGHGYTEAIWNAENNWMDKWLRNGDSPLTIYSDKFSAELTCFPDGEPNDMVNVEETFTHKTPVWNIDSDADYNVFKDTLLQAMRREIIRTAFLDINSKMETISTENVSDYVVEEKKLSINNSAISHKGYYLYKPGEKCKTVILFSKDNIDIWNLKSLFENNYLPQGFNLYCLEITGTGHNPWLADDHWKLSRFAELCGQTQASLQINDILAAIDNIKGEDSIDSTVIYLWGTDDLAAPVLYAAVVNETNISGVILEDAPDKHAGITSVIESNCNTALFNILKYADIPQVAGLIYPRVLILNGKNKDGYSWTENMYKTLGKENFFVKMDGALDEVLKTLKMVTAVKKKEQIIKGFSLEQNYPNPFNSSTTINFSLPKTSDVKISVYNVIGEEIAGFIYDRLPAGFHTVNFNASKLPTGVYIYKITAGKFVSFKKMMLIK